MNFLYITNSRLPTERAHGLQISKTCEALIKKGVDLTLLIPARKQTANLRGKKIESFYDLNVKIKTKKLFTIDLLIGFFPKNLAYILQTFSFSVAEFFYLLRHDFDIIYTREFSSAVALCFLKKNWFFEAHKFPKTFAGKFLHKLVLKKASGLVCISDGLALKYKKLIRNLKIIIANDGVDLNDFKNTKNHTKGLILYTGSPYSEKGVYTLADASIGFKNIVFVGGYEKDPEFIEFKNYAKHAKVLAHLQHKDMVELISKAEILVIPNSAKSEYSKNETSPLKLFEYMASGKKIVASDVPSLKSVLNENMAWFFKADDSKDLKRVLQIALNSKDTKGLLARKEAAKYAWSERAKIILNFCKAQI